MLNHLKSVLILSIFTLLLAFCSSEKKPGEAGNGSGNITNPEVPGNTLPGDMGEDTNGKDKVEPVILDASIQLEIVGQPKMALTIKGNDTAGYATGFNYIGNTGDITEIVNAYFYNPLIVGKDISGYSDVKYVIYDTNGKEIDTINSGDAANDIIITNDDFVSPKNATDLTKRAIWATKYVGHTVRVVLFFTDHGKKSYTILPNITIHA